MLKNYIKIAVRNLTRHKGFSLINILGLAVGMTCAILILLWVNNELSYDRFFKNADNIYMVLRGEKNGMVPFTSKMLAPEMKRELPEVKNTAGFLQLPESFQFLIRNGNIGFEENVILADSNFFKLFSYKFKEGNSRTALSSPNSIVITEEVAKKYFGNKDPIGNTLSVSAFGGKSDMKVSGILENIPPQSHIQRQIFIPVAWFKNIGINFNNWGDQSFQTYVQLKGNSDIRNLPSKIKECELNNNPNHQLKKLSYSLLPLTKIHLYGSKIKLMEFIGDIGDIKNVQMFAAIGVIILLIASINYMNLSTALSIRRSKEVGIKKAVGANRNKLIFQFLGESFILSFISYCFAVLLVELLIPEFNFLTGKELYFKPFNMSFIGFSVLFIIMIGLVSGSYPAFFLSAFSPIQVLKGKMKVSSKNLFTRKGLVVFQFVTTIGIIVCTIIVLNQMSFIKNSNIGFDKENLLCVRMTSEANKKFDVLKNEFVKNPAVVSISRSEPVSSGITHTTDVSWPGKQKGEKKHFCILHTDYNLAATYKFRILHGRYFSKQYPADRTDAFVINEAAAKSMGLKSPLNTKIKVWGKYGKIIGVIKDFHFASFRTAIEPLIFKIPDVKEQAKRYRVMTIRFKSKNPDKLISFLKTIWDKQIAGNPFDYYFYDASLNKQYLSETRMSNIFKYFSFLSILIACLGLFGLVTISAEQRTREIGIRKVLGASVSNVVFIISKDFFILVAISNVIAWPAAYYFMNKWLQNFAYHTNIGWWVFALSGGIVLIVALATISIQAIKAATVNPIKSLRYE